LPAISRTTLVFGSLTESSVKQKNPADPYSYGSTGPEQRRGQMIEANASASQKVSENRFMTDDFEGT
jgi:hypothetical protein